MKKRMTQSEAFDQMLEAAEALGWCIALPDEETVTGMIMGTEEFLEEVAGDEFEIWELASRSKDSGMH